MHLPSVSPLLFTAVISSIFASTTPALALEAGSRNYLGGLKLTFQQCMDNAYKAVNSISNTEIKRDKNSYFTNYSNPISVEVSCVEVGSMSAVLIFTSYTGAEQEDTAVRVQEKMKSVFYSN